MAYATADALKTYLEIDGDDTSDDALLATLVARAQAMIDTHCQQTFEADSDSTRYFYALDVQDGGAVDGRTLVLDAPLCAITSVTNGNGTVVSSTNYITQPLNDTPYYAIRLTANSGLFWTYSTDVEKDTIAVVGKWAYSESAPADIVQACTRLAMFLYRQRESGPDTDRIVNTGNAIYTPVSIPPDIMTTLAPFKRRVP